jgi:ribonuclease inhibitor
METREAELTIELTGVRNSRELHKRLMTALRFPDFYGQNWDAFWDAITGLVEMPLHLRLKGWPELERLLPREAEILRQSLTQAQAMYPSSAATATYD